MQAASAVTFRPDGNVGNANLLGALIAMALPMTVACGFRRDRFFVAWWLGAAVMVGGLLVSTSRSGGFGAFAGCLALVVFALRDRRMVVASAIASGAVMAVALWLVFLRPLGVVEKRSGAA